MSFIREYPPLDLVVNGITPAGRQFRWDRQGTSLKDVYSGLTFSTTMPGGFEHCDVRLGRDPQREFPDLTELETLVVKGLGRKIAWEGRMETKPGVSGDQSQISPAAVGWQAHLEDNASAREIIVDTSLSSWTGMSLARQIQILGATINRNDASSNAAPNGDPALDTSITGAWGRQTICEGWYDAQGLPIGSLDYAWRTLSPGVLATGDATYGVSTNVNWNWAAYLCTDDQASSYDQTNTLRAAGPGSGTLPSTTTRAWALVQLAYGVAGGTDSISYDVWWTLLAVFGAHGLPKYASGEPNGSNGCLGSDIVSYVIGKYAPQLSVNFRGQKTITPSTFVIPQMVWLSPTTAGAMIKDATAFELQDWAVWDEKSFWWAPRNTISLKKQWIARVGPAKLNDAGPQVDRIWNGVVVSYTDPIGHARSVGPPGSGCDTTDPSLLDVDPLNPTNQFTPTLRKWAPLSMGTTTANVAIQIGRIFLNQTKLLNHAGSATIDQYIFDSKGVVWPAWCVRAGDQISFPDASDAGWRRIVSTHYDAASNVNSLTLDVPPDGLQALLARPNVVLGPIMTA